MTKKTKAELEHDLKMFKIARTSETIIAIAITLLKSITVIVVVYFIYRMIDAIAGKYTFTDIGINFLGNLNISITIAWVFGIMGLLYGFRQRTLRKDTVQRLQTRIVEIEQDVDAKRSSSNLTERGDTRPEDRR